MNEQKGKAYRSKEEILAALHNNDSLFNTDVFTASESLNAMEEYATQEKDRQEGWTDEDMIPFAQWYLQEAIKGYGTLIGRDELLSQFRQSKSSSQSTI